MLYLGVPRAATERRHRDTAVHLSTVNTQQPLGQGLELGGAAVVLTFAEGLSDSRRSTSKGEVRPTLRAEAGPTRTCGAVSSIGRSRRRGCRLCSFARQCI